MDVVLASCPNVFVGCGSYPYPQRVMDMIDMVDMMDMSTPLIFPLVWTFVEVHNCAMIV